MWTHDLLNNRTGTAAAASDQLFAPEELAGRLHNFVLTEYGTLRTVVGPVEYRPRDLPGSGTSYTYEAPLKGVFHAVVNGRDILLAQWGEAIYRFNGPTQSWIEVLTKPGTAAGLLNYPRQKATLGNVTAANRRPGPPTQFVALPNGVVIIPQGDRALFTDGEIILPLGFDQIPAPPQTFAPKQTTDPVSGNAGPSGDDTPVEADKTANSGGYSHQTTNSPEFWGNNRLGTINNQALDTTSGAKSNALGGTLEDGEWRAAVQWVDYFGNVSPMSGLSEPATCTTENNLTKDRKRDKDEPASVLRFQVAWAAISPGPVGTIGRLLGRTRDLKNSGIPGVFVISNYSTSGSYDFATLPDNVTDTFPDNIPDSWLVSPMQDYDPVPRMTLATQFDGRLWVNDADQPGLVRPSNPFQWGTFAKDLGIWTNTQGSPITGMYAVAGRMLVFTATATFIIAPNEVGDGYISATLHPSVGCVAPDSIKSLPNGTTVWLGREGFYGYDGSDVVRISDNIEDTVIRRINKGYRIGACAVVDPTSGEYRCAIPIDGSKVNNLTVVFDDLGWRTRDDVYPAAMCVTRDERQLVLALGSASVSGVRKNSLWVLDHDGDGTASTDPVTSIYETVWLRNGRSYRNASPKVARFWLRATRDDTLTLETFRDGRAYPPLQTEPEVKRYAEAEEFTPFWNQTVLAGNHVERERCGTFTNYWVRRRNYWAKEDIDIPACETFKFRITGTGDWEFVMAIYEERDSYGGGAKMQGSY